MKTLRRFLPLVLFIPIIFLACKSTPTGTDETPAPAAQGELSQETLDALAAAKSKADEARNSAVLVHADTYCPDDWTAAESRYGNADSAPAPQNQGEAQSRIDEWNAIAQDYDSMFGKAAPQFASEGERELKSARQDAVQAGAMDLFPDRMAKNDALAQSAADKYASGDYKGALNDGYEAYKRYKTLGTLSEADSRKKEADDLNFYAYDSQNYDLASSAGNKAYSDYDAGNLDSALDSAEESLLRFNLVLQNGWEAYSGERADAAKGQRQAAMDAKANVAARDAFADAEEEYNEAFVSLRAKDFKDAVSMFDDAGAKYRRCIDMAEDKRKLAEEKLNAAKQKVAESGEMAKKADETIGEDEK